MSRKLIKKYFCSFGIFFCLSSQLTFVYVRQSSLLNKFSKIIDLNENYCQAEKLISFVKRFSSLNFTSTHSPNMEPDTKFPSLQKIGVLSKDNILIKDKKNTEKIVASILSGKFDSLQLLVDFDYTLTRGHFNGENALCTWGVLDNSPHMPAYYKERSLQLLHKFYPIEIDPKKPEEEKIPHMIEWYTTVLELLKSCNLSKEILREMVAESNIKLRYDTEYLFKKLKDKEVPMLIFSAGMGDVLEHMLWHFGLYTENVKVVSNFFKYNGEGIMIGFKGDIIHVFNKNENAIHSSDYFDLLKHRTNIILMGDSLGDVKMAKGVPQPSNILKIGFFNHKLMNDRVTSYLDAYDIVLVEDQTMKVVNSILSNMKR